MRRILPLLIAGMAITACGGESPTACTAPSPVQPTLSATVSAMEEVESARFEMVRSGAPVEVQGMLFDRAVGQYAAPDAARALLDVRVGDVAVQVGTIAIDSQTWITNPLTGAWEVIPPGTGFNAATVFAPDTGWPDLVANLDTPRYTAPESGCDGAVVVEGSVDATRVEALTLGLVTDQAVAIVLWIDPDSHLLSHAEFITTGPEGRSDWAIRLFDYGEPVEISAPD